jgi:hypothetical protein
VLSLSLLLPGGNVAASVAADAHAHADGFGSPVPGSILLLLSCGVVGELGLFTGTRLRVITLLVSYQFS